MQDFSTALAPLPGGWSGETFLAEAGGERTVVRVYAGRSLARGPLAPEVDAAVLRLVAPVMPVPRVLEARRGDPDHDLPGLLVCSWAPGERLEDVLPRLDPDGWSRVGEALGVLLVRLGLALQPRSGWFVDHRLDVRGDPPPLDEWVERYRDALPVGCREGLGDLVDEALDLLGEDPRHVLVHGDFNPKNLLVDPDSLAVTAVLDWEYAHAGGAWEDLGNLLRHLPDDDAGRALARAALRAYGALVPGVPDDVAARAEAADLAALVELAARSEETPPVRSARQRLRRGLEAPSLGWTWRAAGA